MFSSRIIRAAGQEKRDEAVFCIPELFQGEELLPEKPHSPEVSGEGPEISKEKPGLGQPFEQPIEPPLEQSLEQSLEPPLEQSLRHSLEQSPGTSRREQLLREAESARREARQLLEESRREAEQLRRAAEEEGWQEGFRRGQEAGIAAGEQLCRREQEEQLRSFRETMESTLEELKQVKEELTRQHLRELQEIAAAVAEKVIYANLRSSGAAVRRMILKEAERIHPAAWIRIFMDRNGYELLMQTDAQIAEALSSVSGNVSFTVLDQAEEGFCRIETPEEILDLSVSAQMKRIRESISRAAGA